MRVWKAAIDQGWSVQRLPGWRIPDHLRHEKRDLVVYAEPLFAEAVADQLDMVLLEPPPDWLVRLPSRFTHRGISLCSLAEARKLQAPIFVKPAEGKVFDARVYTSGEDLPKAEQVDDTLPVLTSEPVTWQLEVRCFILDRKIMTLSPYWRGGQLAQAGDGSWPFLPGEEEGAQEFARGLLEAEDVGMPPAFVLDIGITTEHGWAVIEGNPCWGAGLYGCSAQAALQTAHRAIRSKTTLVQADRRWTSPRVQKQLAIWENPSPKDDRE